MPWTHSPVGQVQGVPPQYTKATELGLVLPDPGAAVESNIGTSVFKLDPSNSIFLLGIIVTNANGSVNGNLNARIQCSPDGVGDWTTADTMSLAVDNSGTNKGWGNADLSLWTAPYWRAQVFSDGTDIGAAVTLTVEYIAIDYAGRIPR